MVSGARLRSKGISRTALLAAAAILVSAPTASGQSAADQYIPALDRGGVTGGPAGTSAPSPAGTSAPSVGSTEEPKGSPAKLVAKENLDEGDDGGGSVPGSDFPLTSFVVGLALVVALALAARVLVPMARRRLASDRTG